MLFFQFNMSSTSIHNGDREMSVFVCRDVGIITRFWMRGIRALKKQDRALKKHVRRDVPGRQRHHRQIRNLARDFQILLAAFYDHHHHSYPDGSFHSFPSHQSLICIVSEFFNTGKILTLKMLMLKNVSSILSKEDGLCLNFRRDINCLCLLFPMRILSYFSTFNAKRTWIFFTI